MALGTVRTLVICSDAAEQAAPCPAGQAPQAVQAYVVDPASASYLEQVSEPFDYGLAAAFWSAAFVSTLVIYIGSRVYGEIIAMVRRGL